jgi:hexokinase
MACLIVIYSLINDTTGTLIASQYVRPRTKIAVILGTGCNAAYSEEIKCIGKLKEKGCDGNDTVAINCEWVSRSLSRRSNS